MPAYVPEMEIAKAAEQCGIPKEEIGHAEEKEKEEEGEEGKEGRRLLRGFGDGFRLKVRIYIQQHY